MVLSNFKGQKEKCVFFFPLGRVHSCVFLFDPFLWPKVSSDTLTLHSSRRRATTCLHPNLIQPQRRRQETRAEKHLQMIRRWAKASAAGPAQLSVHSLRSRNVPTSPRETAKGGSAWMAHFITACRVQSNNSSRPSLQPLFTAFRQACKSALLCRIWLIGGGVGFPYKFQSWVKAQQKTVGGLLVPRPLWRDWFPTMTPARPKLYGWQLHGRWRELIT